jgi:hypothetical protein
MRYLKLRKKVIHDQRPSTQKQVPWIVRGIGVV